MTERDTGKLQRIQNIAARIVQRARHHEPITPILSALHWLPIDKRIKFKILLLTFKALNGTAPAYISELLHKYTPTRTLRSQHQQLLQAPRFHTQHYGYRTFSVTAPILWNKLPAHIRQHTTMDSFKSSLKTHLFLT